MGEIIVEIELENAGDRGLARAGHLREADVRRTAIRAVADTGAMMLALPADVVSRLGIGEIGSVNATHADGRRGELPIAGPLTVRIGDRRMATDCVVVPVGADALIGQIVMQRLDLIADCANQTLGPRPESPDRSLLRV